MYILGMDTSGKMASVALYDEQARCFLGQNAVRSVQTHSQVILPLAERMLADTGLTLEDIGGFAVAIGPGSYTGLRIGISAVQALSYGLQTPCAGVSTLAGLAWQNVIWRGTLCPVLWARKSLYYVGFYQSDGVTVTQLEPDTMLEDAEISQKVQQYGDPVLFCGDGVTAWQDAPYATLASPATQLPNGSGVCLAAAAASAWGEPETLKPAYLQPVKAEKDRRTILKKGLQSE